MNNNIKVGIIGCGTISHTHLDAINKSDYSHIGMICDTNEQKAKKYAKEFNVNYTTSYEEMLTREDLESIHILTPHDLHIQMAIKALENNKHVLLEKPVGITLKELDLLEITAKKTNKKITVSFQNRFNRTSMFAKNLIQSNELGEFLFAKGVVTWHRDENYYKTSDWRGKKLREGGGVLINQAIHTVDLLRYLIGDVESIKGSIDNTNHPYIDTEDTAMVTLYHKNKGITNFYATNNYGVNSCIEIELLYEHGTLKFYNNELIYENTNNNEITIIKEGYSTKEKAYWGTSHDILINKFYKAIKTQAPVPITLTDAILSNKIILQIYESSLSNQHIKI